MKKIIILITAFLAVSCNTSETKNEVVVENLTKEEKLKELYLKTVKPLFKEFTEVDIPNEFRIDKHDTSVNAGAAMNYVEVSQGLIDYDKDYIKAFVLAHELGHIVTLKQAEQFNLGTEIPNGTKINAYKKAEYLADIIAVHLITTQEVELGNDLKTNFEVLQNLLGPEIFTHPGAVDRVALMKEYVEKSTKENAKTAFQEMFIRIWKLE
ncbi:M48 family metalloprotease [Tenacibaculum singaporense]|uniref:M48 family metalloprotease n=1 Tax=Tenacibaculum singaporense TaxID=2358479 RepID=UPI00351776C3